MFASCGRWTNRAIRRCARQATRPDPERGISGISGGELGGACGGTESGCSSGESTGVSTGPSGVSTGLSPGSSGPGPGGVCAATRDDAAARGDADSSPKDSSADRTGVIDVLVAVDC